MRRLGVIGLWIAFLGTPMAARHNTAACGTTAETAGETLFLHRQAERARIRLRPLAAAPAADRDIGNIAIIEDTDGIVARQNQFNLDLKTLQFVPSAPN